MGISSATLDFYDDGGEGMAKVAMPAELGDLQVQVLSPDEHAELRDTDFGLIVLTKHASVLRKFPVNDAGNAWISAQYFHQNHRKLAFPARFIAARFIKAACGEYDVPSSQAVEAYAGRLEDDEITSNTFAEGSETSWMLRKHAQAELHEKTAAAEDMDALLEMPDAHFALVIHGEDGNVIRKYAMPDASLVKEAADYFEKYARQLTPAHRRTFAVSVRRRAEELGVDLGGDSLVEKLGSDERNPRFTMHIEQRKALLPRHPEARAILEKLAASLHETSPENMATALETFDASTGLDRYYDKALTDPHATTMRKIGSSWSADVDGRLITEDDLRKVASRVGSYFGSSFAEHFGKDPGAIFDSLPDPDKVLIKQMVDGGV